MAVVHHAWRRHAVATVGTKAESDNCDNSLTLQIRHVFCRLGLNSVDRLAKDPSGRWARLAEPSGRFLWFCCAQRDPHFKAFPFQTNLCHKTTRCPGNRPDWLLHTTAMDTIAPADGTHYPQYYSIKKAPLFLFPFSPFLTEHVN